MTEIVYLDMSIYLHQVHGSHLDGLAAARPLMGKQRESMRVRACMHSGRRNSLYRR